MKYFVLVMLLLAGPAYAETKTQVQVPEPPVVTPGWILCMNPNIARRSSACRMFVLDGPAPVWGASK